LAKRTKTMSEINSYIVKSIEEIKSDIKTIFTRFEIITNDLQSYKHQKYKCQSECDTKYLRLSDIESIFKRELDKYYIQKTKTNHRKTEMVKNIIHIILAVAPYVAIAGTYLVLTQ